MLYNFLLTGKVLDGPLVLPRRGVNAGTCTCLSTVRSLVLDPSLPSCENDEGKERMKRNENNLNL